LFFLQCYKFNGCAFRSDNGGCETAGGKDAPLRGAKGTLFEGGTKVDGLLYSSLIHSEYRGTVFSGVMHVTDWFPTILELTRNQDFVPAVGYELDGVSQVSGFKGGISMSSRKDMVYGLWIDSTEEWLHSNSTVAVRNAQYKLLYSYAGFGYYEVDEVLGDDDISEVKSCIRNQATGNYSYYLFDILADPYETTNLYGLENYATVQVTIV
jgi:arylsulfatase A-like enzyme